MDRESAIKILRELQKNYDIIAEDFSATRSYIWPEFKDIVNYFAIGDRVLDLGCGNGRFFNLFLENQLIADYHGIDISQKLIDLARIKYPGIDWHLTDGLKIPYPDNYFDKIICIAVMHHLPKPLHREFLAEAQRVLKPGGMLIISSWALSLHKKYLKHLLKYSWLKIIGKSDFAWGEFYLPWSNKGQRFIHYFTRNCLKKLLRNTNLHIRVFKYICNKNKQRNLFAVAEK